MKDYEIYSNIVVPKNSNIILRLDGRSFHSLSKFLNLDKPYDCDFLKLMAKISVDLFNEFSPLFIYTFSDEINVLLNKIPFNGRIEKINSVIASFTASSFTYHLNNELHKPVAFDSRIIPITDKYIYSYFKWRQDEAWRNCVNAYGINFLKSKYSSKEANDKIRGLKLSDIHELLFQNGINLNNIETYKKRGIAIYRQDSKINIDLDIPIFSKEFFDNLIGD